MKHLLRYNILWLSLVLGATFHASLTARAQETSGGDEETIRVHTRLVSVTALPTDERGRPLPIPASSLRVAADGLHQEIAFASEAPQASVILLVDASTSMTGEPGKHVRFAVESFLKAADPRNVYALVVFSDSVKLVGSYQGDAAGQAQLVAALSQQPVVGNTALYDACLEALRLAPAPEGLTKRAMVVFTDGHDTASEADASALSTGLDELGGLTYVIVLSSTTATDPNRYDKPFPDLMQEEATRRLRAAVNVEALAPRNRRSLARAVAEVARGLSSSVQLGFYPSASASLQGVHALSVSSTDPRVRVRARTRFFIE